MDIKKVGKVEIETNSWGVQVGTPCLLCGDFVPLDSVDDRSSKICDSCKTAFAILKQKHDL